MALLVHCSTCKGKLRVPDNLLGRKVKCPRCNTMFVAAAEPAAAPAAPPPPVRRSVVPPVETRESYEESRPPAPARVSEERLELVTRNPSRGPYDEDDEDFDDGPRRPARARRGDWRKIHLGLTMILGGIVLVIVVVAITFVAFIIGGMAAFSMLSGGNRDEAMSSLATLGVVGFIINLITILLLGLARVLNLVGYGMCIYAPPRFAAKTLAIITLVLGGLTTVVILFSPFAQMIFPVAGGIFVYLAMLLYFGEGLVFVFCLRGIARNLKENALAASCNHLATLMVANLVLQVVMCVVSLLATLGLVGFGAAAAMSAKNQGEATQTLGALGTAGGLMGILGMVCGCFMIILGLIQFIWFIMILMQARIAVSYRT